MPPNNRILFALVAGCVGVSLVWAQPPAHGPVFPQDHLVAEAEETDAGSFSYALFLKAQRKLTRADVEAAMIKTWQLDKESVGKIKLTETASEFTIRFQGASFLIKTEQRPWLEDQKQIIDESSDRHMNAMLRQVTSNLSITVEGPFKSDQALDLANENAVRLLSGFIDLKDTLAIYDDDTGDFNYINQEVVDAMRADDPLSAFTIEVIPPVGNDNLKTPAYLAAVAEAKRRWPEFAKNFRDHGTTRGPFIVKAKFTSGEQSEFLWMEVMGVMPGKITGVLKTSPTKLPMGLEGDQVTVPLTEMVDWVYPDEEGEKVGAFTLDVK